MPFRRHDIAKKRVERLIVTDQALVRNPWVPVIQDIAAVEETAATAVNQPWRALKRRLVLLMT